MTIKLSKVELDKQKIKGKTRKLDNGLLNQITGGYILSSVILDIFYVYNNRTHELYNQYTDKKSAENADTDLNGFISWLKYRGVPLWI